MLTTQEREMVVEEWNQTASEFPSTACVHHLFETQASRTPDAVALVFEFGQWTYSELNARSNQLAHYLKQRGVGPETLVGISVERSPEMAVGLLGILKAGGAFVPLDPAYPRERLAFMMADAGDQSLAHPSFASRPAPPVRVRNHLPRRGLDDI